MKNLLNLIAKFKSKKVLVLGDVMVDKFVWGKVSRISPEAPVPVVEVTRETYAFGGAGNVANNILSLGGEAHLVGVIGQDTAGDKLFDDIRLKNIYTDGIVRDLARPTIVKTRIIAQHQQVCRVDKEVKGGFSAKLLGEILLKIEALMPKVDALIISDYGKGMISEQVLKKAIGLAHKLNIPVTVDPKIEHFQKYKKVTCITPNFNEAIQGMRYHDVSGEEEVYVLGRKILKKLNSKSVLITRGEKGMTLFEPGDKITHIPTRAKEVYDVTGAGDTVISTLTLALAAGASLSEAAEISNFAAGIVVGKIGTATATPEELRKVILNFRNGQ